MNVFTFTGNLGRDAEVRYTGNGTAVCSFPVANTIRKGSDNEETVWVRCAIFGKRAESKLPQYLTKGTKVTVTGEASLNEYEKDGQNRASLQCFVQDVDLHGGGQERENTQQGHQQGGGGQDFDQDFEDSIPF